MHGFRVMSDGDDVYAVRDRERTLGGVVRHLVPARDGKGFVRRFRAFGEDFETLSDAVREFGRVRGAKPFDDTGDDPAWATVRRTLR